MPSDQVIHAVDDDPPFLNALQRSLLSTGLTVNTYCCATEFIERIDAGQPGCLITDLRMPDLDGLALQRYLLERHIRIPIIFVTGHGDTSAAVTALKNGAVDFLEKPFSEKKLLSGVRRALERDARDREIAAERAVVRDRYAGLTPRERQVFGLVVSDLPNKEIAFRLKISPRTVEHHREHLMLKMQANSLTELLTMAVLCGIHELHLHH